MGRRGNPDEGVEPSRYHRLFDLLDDTIRPKTLFMLTATPINNRLSDFRHMTELFTRRDGAYFARTLGVNNLRYMRKFYLAFPICHAPCDELESTEKRNAPRSKSADPPTDDAEDESSVAQTKPMLRPELSWTLEKGLRGAGPRRGILRLRGNAGQR